MNEYYIRWKSNVYGTSKVIAESEEEARKIANDGLDDSFEVDDDGLYEVDWVIHEVILNEEDVE